MAKNTPAAERSERGRRGDLVLRNDEGGGEGERRLERRKRKIEREEGR